MVTAEFTISSDIVNHDVVETMELYYYVFHYKDMIYCLFGQNEITEHKYPGGR